jgi:hypothetical protein
MQTLKLPLPSSLSLPPQPSSVFGPLSPVRTSPPGWRDAARRSANGSNRGDEDKGASDPSQAGARIDVEHVEQLKGGDKSLLVNSRNLCKAPGRAQVRMIGQNGVRGEDFYTCRSKTSASSCARGSDRSGGGGHRPGCP